jgi:hypothetical protein
MPIRIRNRWMSFAMLVPLALIGCDPLHERGCACSTELRINVCAQGKYEGMDSVTYRRERGNGALDSLFLGDKSCFEELPGKQRILVLKNGARIDSSAWFTLRTVDCCHGEEHTVTF